MYARSPSTGRLQTTAVTEESSNGDIDLVPRASPDGLSTGRCALVSTPIWAARHLDPAPLVLQAAGRNSGIVVDMDA